MECVAYMRVSTEKQAEEGNGLDSQKRDIMAFAGKNDMFVTEWYVDDGYTGANMERPALKRLIEDCMAKRVKNVVAFKLDRLSRSMVDGIYIIERIFLPNDIRFQCVHDSVSYDSPMEQAYTQMMAVFAQLDKNTMMLRMRGGMLERIKKGYWQGGGNTPYCYKYDKEQGILIPIPERKILAKKAMELFLDGYSDVFIARKLGIKQEHTVKMILTSPVNAGKIPYKGGVYDGLHEPIFTEDEFNRALKLREQRRKKRSFSAHRHYMLTGLCKCGVCGCAMRYQKWTHGRHKIYCYSRNSYQSYLPNHNPNCTNSLEWADEIEEKVVSLIKEISLDLDGYMDRESVNMEDVLQTKLDSVNKKLERLYDIYSEGNDIVIEKIREHEQEKKKILESIEFERKSNGNIEEKRKTLREVKKIADVWDEISDQGKNAILKSIIDEVVIVNGNVEIKIKNF